MPFGPKPTVGISGHYSEAWAIGPWLGAEVCGSRKHAEDVEDSGSELESSGIQWKWWKMLGSGGRHVGDGKGVGRGAGEVWEVQKRSGRLWESAEEAGRHGK